MGIWSIFNTFPANIPAAYAAAGPKELNPRPRIVDPSADGFLAAIVNQNKINPLLSIRSVGIPRELRNLDTEIKRLPRRFRAFSWGMLKVSQHNERYNQKLVKKAADNLLEMSIKYRNLGNREAIAYVDNMQNNLQKNVVDFLKSRNLVNTKNLRGQSEEIRQGITVAFQTIEDFLGVIQTSYFMRDRIAPAHLAEVGERQGRVWSALIEQGYINNNGVISDKFANTSAASFRLTGFNRESSAKIYTVLERNSKKRFLFMARDALINNFLTEHRTDPHRITAFNRLNILSYLSWILTELVNNEPDRLKATSYLNQATTIYETMLRERRGNSVSVNIGGVQSPTYNFIKAQRYTGAIDIRSNMTKESSRDERGNKIEYFDRRFNQIRFHAQMGLVGSYLIFHRYKDAERQYKQITNSGSAYSRSIFNGLRNYNPEFNKNYIASGIYLKLGRAGELLEEGYARFDNTKFIEAYNLVNNLSVSGIPEGPEKNNLEASVYTMRAATLTAAGQDQDWNVARNILRYDIFGLKNHFRYSPIDVNLNQADLAFATNNVGLIPGFLGQLPSLFGLYSYTYFQERAEQGIFGQRARRTQAEQKFRSYWLALQSRLTIARRNDDRSALQSAVNDLEHLYSRHTFNFGGEELNLAAMTQINQEEVRIIAGDNYSACRGIFTMDSTANNMRFRANAASLINRLPIAQHKRRMLLSLYYESKRLENIFYPEMIISIAEGYIALENPAQARLWLSRLPVGARRGVSDRMPLRRELAFAALENLSGHDINAMKHFRKASGELAVLRALPVRDVENFNFLINLGIADIHIARGNFEAALYLAQDRNLSKASDIRNSIRRDMVVADAYRGMGYYDWSRKGQVLVDHFDTALATYGRIRKEHNISFSSIEQGADNAAVPFGNDTYLTGPEKAILSGYLRMGLAEGSLALGAVGKAQSLLRHEGRLINIKDPFRANIRPRMLSASIAAFQGNISSAESEYKSVISDFNSYTRANNPLRPRAVKGLAQTYAALTALHLRTENIEEARSSIKSLQGNAREVGRFSKSTGLMNEVNRLTLDYYWTVGSMAGLRQMRKIADRNMAEARRSLAGAERSKVSRIIAERSLVTSKQLSGQVGNHFLDLAVRRRDPRAYNRELSAFNALALNHYDRGSAELLVENKLLQSNWSLLFGNYRQAENNLFGARTEAQLVQPGYQLPRIFSNVVNLSYANYYSAVHNWAACNTALQAIHPAAVRTESSGPRFGVNTANGLLDEEFYFQARRIFLGNLLTQGNYAAVESLLGQERTLAGSLSGTYSGNTLGTYLGFFSRDLDLLNLRFTAETSSPEGNAALAVVRNHTRRTVTRRDKEYVLDAVNLVHDTRKFVYTEKNRRILSYNENQRKKAIEFFTLRSTDSFFRAITPLSIYHQPLAERPILEILGPETRSWPNIFNRGRVAETLLVKNDVNVDRVIGSSKLPAEQAQKLIFNIAGASLFDFAAEENDQTRIPSIYSGTLSYYFNQKVERQNLYARLPLAERRGLFEGLIDLSMRTPELFPKAENALSILYFNAAPQVAAPDSFIKNVSVFRNQLPSGYRATPAEKGFAYYCLIRMILDNNETRNSAKIVEYVGKAIGEINGRRSSTPADWIRNIQELPSVRYCNEPLFLIMNLLVESRFKLNDFNVPASGGHPGINWNNVLDWSELRTRVRELKANRLP